MHNAGHPRFIDRIEIAEYPASVWVLWVLSQRYDRKWALVEFGSIRSFGKLSWDPTACSSIAVLVEGFCHLDFGAFALLLPARHVIKRGGGLYNDLNGQVGRLPPLRSKCLSV